MTHINFRPDGTFDPLPREVWANIPTYNGARKCHVCGEMASYYRIETDTHACLNCGKQYQHCTNNPCTCK